MRNRCSKPNLLNECQDTGLRIASGMCFDDSRRRYGRGGMEALIQGLKASPLPMSVQRLSSALAIAGPAAWVGAGTATRRRPEGATGCGHG